MRKFSIILLFSLLLFNLKAFAISASSYILIDAGSGRVLLQGNADVRRGMASTTKIMTAIVAIENGDLDSIVTVSKNASLVEGSSMWLKEGEQISLKSLLYGLMLNSGNDAATAIAEHISGDIAKFAELMNKKARELNLKNTNFTNPHGLDNENLYTTAYELALITRYALKNEVFCEIVNTKLKTINEGVARTLKNHNKMLTLYDNADGVKTGFTKKCGRCLVSSATNDDLRLIAVTLNAPDDWNDHKALLDYGFSKYQNVTLLNKDSYVKTIDVSKGSTVKTYINESLSVAVKKNEKPVLVFDLPTKLTAPVIIDEKVGEAKILINNAEITSCDILAKNGVSTIVNVNIFDTVYYLFFEVLSNFV